MTESPEEEIIEAALVDEDDASHGRAEPSSAQQTSPAQTTAAGESPEGDATGAKVRTGSPFAVDPPQVEQRAQAYAARSRPFEAGMWTITAGGAVLSAAMLIPFGLAAFWFFPGGAVAVAALGGVMSLAGLSSLYPRWAVGLLIVHIGLFVVSELRVWT